MQKIVLVGKIHEQKRPIIRGYTPCFLFNIRVLQNVSGENLTANFYVAVSTKNENRELNQIITLKDGDLLGEIVYTVGQIVPSKNIRYADDLSPFEEEKIPFIVWADEFDVWSLQHLRREQSSIGKNTDYEVIK